MRVQTGSRGLLAASLLIVSACTTSHPDHSDLGTFVDAFIESKMKEQQIPGAAFAFVHDGKVVYAKGYGLADVERKIPVTPEGTIWRIGSITKAVTATAVMQLVERRGLDLDREVSAYVKSVPVPAGITVRQLLDHTSGLDEIRPGTQAPTRDELLPLADFLRPRLAVARPPGQTISYSTYGITLAGLVIEEVTGLSYNDYLARNVWQPLGMKHASLHVPPGSESDFAAGYELEKDVLTRQRWEWYHTAPASSMNATALEMAAFVNAHLRPSPLLGNAAKREMHRQQITMHPKIPGYAIGFNEDFIGALRVIEHGGNMAGFSTQLVMIPQYGDGFFLANHFENSKLRDDLKYALLERYYPEAKKRHPVPPAVKRDQSRFAGRYIPTTSCHTCKPPSAPYVLNVTANDDGTLTFAGGRWFEVEPLLFVRQGGTGYIAFRADAAGAITHLFAGSFWSWEKVPD